MVLRHSRHAMLAIAINLFTGFSSARGGASEAPPSHPFETRAAVSQISVLSYNIKGMPWPAAWGRDAAMDRIAARLAAYRRQGTQPDIVLLQEAFTDTAREIGRRAGYRHVVFGPDAGQVPTGEDTEPLGRDWVHGEAIGKSVGSGLAILSDFPILSVATVAYGDHACAGFDCLANKGAMMAMIRVPGQREPVRVFNTHLNARTASGVAVSKANLAFRRQLGLFARFVRREETGSSAPVIIGGDFNIGKDEERRAAFSALSTTGSVPGYVALDRASGALLVHRNAIAGGRHGADMRAIVRRRKDLMFASPSLRPVRASVPFGTEASGPALSDHFGYRIDYALRSEPGRRAVRVAASDLSDAAMRSFRR